MSKLFVQRIISPYSVHNLFSTSASGGGGKGKGSSKRPVLPIGSVPLERKSSKSRNKKENKNLRSSEIDAKANLLVPKSNKNVRKFSNTDDNGLPLLSQKDCFRRVEFASRMLELFRLEPTILHSIIFSDEGNFRIHDKDKRHAKERKKGGSKKKLELMDQKIYESATLPQIVWCGMTTKLIIGPYFFNSHVTDRTYLKMLQTYLRPQIQRLETPPSGYWWFQQDGAPPHRSKAVLAYLKKEFGSRLVSYGCPIAWPPKSQDLTPLDYFLWNHLKNKLHSNFLPSELNSKDKFRRSLIRQIQETDESLLTEAINQLPTRLEKCIRANGERFT